VIYKFGIECGIGAEKLSGFFKLIRLDTHVGVSPSAIGQQLKKMELLLPQFQASCEQKVKGGRYPSVVAMDETFFGDLLILVLMDLRSGYLLLEDISDDRCFDTWFSKAKPRLNTLGIDIQHAVSDRAKALIKLAINGFECESGADLFHAQQDASRWLGPTLAKRITAAEKQKAATEMALNKKSRDTQIKQAHVEAVEQVKHAVQAQSDYHEALQGMSEDLHPFSLRDDTANNASILEDKLNTRVHCFDTIAQDQGIADKRNSLKKLKNQLPALAIHVKSWWLWVDENLKALETETALREWITLILLPVIYWHYQLHRTQNPKTREKYQIAWERASQTLREHEASALFLSEGQAHWVEWADWMVRQFHRSSSAVEGRNGCLSQMYHNGRGITESRLKALTVIHNYGLKRNDGTTAAERLFATEFPDLFSWLLEQMGALPLPRKGRTKVTHDPLKLLGVPA